MKIEALTPEESAGAALTEEELKKMLLKRAIEKARAEREAGTAMTSEPEQMEEVDYSQLPRDAEEARRFLKLRELLGK